jgi:hypothetical protein
MTAARVVPPGPVRGWWIAGLGAVLVLVLPFSPPLVEEFYSRLVYRWVQAPLTSLSNLAPFAVLDALIVFAVAGVSLRAVWLLRSAWHRGLLASLVEAFQRTVRLAGIVVLVFFAAWGCNYRRLPLDETTTGKPSTTPDVAQLEAAVRQSAATAAKLRPAVHAEPVRDLAAVGRALRDPMNVALARLDLPPLGEPGVPKTSVLLTPWFTWTGVNGMVNPLGLESIVHARLLPFEQPFVLAHEWAHLAGHADEAEANALGWFACMHGDAAMRYSGSLYLLMEAAGALPADARKRALARLDPGVREDLAAIARRMTAERPRIRQAASRVYDEYLRANRVEDGTASYSRALRLILSPFMQEAVPAGGAR